MVSFPRGVVPRLVAAFLAIMPLSGAHPDGMPRMFDIPEGRAESTLPQFGKQAGGQFIFSQEKVTGVRTVEVKGRFSPLAALSRMLAGTPLLAVQDPQTGALTVGRRDAESRDSKDAVDPDQYAKVKEQGQ